MGLELELELGLELGLESEVRCVPADSRNGQKEGAPYQGRGRAEAALSDAH